MAQSPKILFLLAALAMLGPAPRAAAAVPDPSFAPKRGWRGYLGSVEGTVRTTIDRARLDAMVPSLRSPLPNKPPARSAAGSEGESDGAVPGRLWLGPVAPNPSAGRVTLRFDLPAAARVRVAVVDVVGRIVRDVDRTMEAGRHAFALDLPGGRNASGVYFLIMDVDGRRVGSRRLVLLR